MDGPTGEQSDSDSSSSWTFLDSQQAESENAGEVNNAFILNDKEFGECSDCTDKDDDTDGISVISESEADISRETLVRSVLDIVLPNPTPQIDNENEFGDRTAESQNASTHFGSNHANNSSASARTSTSSETADATDIAASKIKTYTHKRNKEISTMLNIILLGSVITAAGLAVGHMWGINDDCMINNTTTVGEILAKIQKLEEENAYLRNQLKVCQFREPEMHISIKGTSDKEPGRRKYKKVFEGPLMLNENQNIVGDECQSGKVESDISFNENTDQAFGDLLDENNNVIGLSHTENHMSGRLEEIYHEINDKSKVSSGKNVNHLRKEQIRVYEPPMTVKYKLDKVESSIVKEKKLNKITEAVPLIKTYAESLKTTTNYDYKPKPTTDSIQTNKVEIKRLKRSSEKFKKGQQKKLKLDVQTDSRTDDWISDEDEPRKDNRFHAHKRKLNNKKEDKRKVYKKQKRENKYEQWEMKGGYKYDFDSISMFSNNENFKSEDLPVVEKDKVKVEVTTSAKDKTVPSNNKSEDKKNKASKQNMVKENVSMNRIKTADNNVIEDESSADWFAKRSEARKTAREAPKPKDGFWSEKRSAARRDAREMMLFEEQLSNKNARWYFQRRKERDQCRVQNRSDTGRRYNKRTMNFKMRR